MYKLKREYLGFKIMRRTAIDLDDKLTQLQLEILHNDFNGQYTEYISPKPMEISNVEVKKPIKRKTKKKNDDNNTEGSN